jgi:hypothetical protein
MTVIRFRQKYDTDPAELLLTRIGHHLWLDRRRALKAEDVQGVFAAIEGMQTVQELFREVQEENLESWKDRKAA